MLPDRAQAAWDALQAARERSGRRPSGGAGADRALSTRYKGPQPVDPPSQQPANEAFAAAMRDVARAHPADDDVQIIFAEA
jgi:hypothetical protein